MIDMIRTPCISSGRDGLAPKTLRYHTVDELRFEEDLWHSWRYAGIRFMRVCRIRSRRLRRLLRKIAAPDVLDRMSVQFTLDDSRYRNERCIIHHKLPPYPAVRIDRQTPGTKSPLCISAAAYRESRATLWAWRKASSTDPRGERIKPPCHPASRQRVHIHCHGTR